MAKKEKRTPCGKQIDYGKVVKTLLERVEDLERELEAHAVVSGKTHDRIEALEKRPSATSGGTIDRIWMAIRDLQERYKREHPPMCSQRVHYYQMLDNVTLGTGKPNELVACDVPGEIWDWEVVRRKAAEMGCRNSKELLEILESADRVEQALGRGSKKKK